MNTELKGFSFKIGICRLAIRVKPNSHTHRIIGYNPERNVIEIALNAQPREGEANAALVDVLKSSLKVPKEKIKIVSGLKNRDKIVEIECSPEQIENLLNVKFSQK